MDTTWLYPDAKSIYTLSDGSTQDVECFVPGAAREASGVECPAPFVSPIASDHLESCIQPCPVEVYTDEEYTMLWGLSNGIQLVGFALSLFMVSTWGLAGWKHFNAQPYQLKACVFGGILYGLVGTLPSLVLKYDLACGCETEEW